VSRNFERSGVALSRGLGYREHEEDPSVSKSGSIWFDEDGDGDRWVLGGQEARQEGGRELRSLGCGEGEDCG
jgi:hypothetical protein